MPASSQHRDPAAPRASASGTPVAVSIVIVNWNSCRYVRECLAALRAHCRCAHEVIVVDSGSFDGCDAMLAREFPAARYVQSAANIGFAAANNLGARAAMGALLLFLNPDTEVVGAAVERLVQVLAEHPAAGLAGARLLNTDGSLQTSCIQSFPTVLNQLLDAEWLRRRFPRSRLWGVAPLHDPSTQPAAVEVVSGACILIRRAVFEALGGFDQRFFMYSEDLDLCHRTRRAGWQCLYVPDAVIVHHGGGSSSAGRSSFSVVMMRESVCRLLRFHRGAGVALAYRLALGAAAIVRLPLTSIVAVARRLRGRPNAAASLRKWFAILRWSLGLEAWAAAKSGPRADEPVAVTGGERSGLACASAPEVKKSCVA